MHPWLPTPHNCPASVQASDTTATQISAARASQVVSQEVAVATTRTKYFRKEAYKPAPSEAIVVVQPQNAALTTVAAQVIAMPVINVRADKTKK